MIRLASFTVLAALVVFCMVQDRVTADGAASYVSRQRAALASGAAPVAIADVMGPAIRQSVRQGLIWSGGVVVVGLAAAAVVRGAGRE